MPPVQATVPRRFGGGILSAVLFIGETIEATTTLARSLGASTGVSVPEQPRTPTWAWNWRETIDAWRNELVDGPPVDRVVVCTWPARITSAPVISLSPEEWRAQVEWPLALWFNALAVAAQRCADGGSIVAVVELPSAIDAFGHGTVVTVAEGLLTLVRSLAAREGGRQVRVNAVTTELFTAPAVLTGSPPPLSSFPGRVDVEVAGAVQLLGSPDASGLTGAVLRATGGRA
jgi:NAD(P)-dependent dehydrogenase (short-subunit alcohol dehydrogenase family)